MARGQTSRRDGTERSRSALVATFIAPAIWSSGSSTRSSNVGGSRRVTTSSRQTTSPSSGLHQSDYGCAYEGGSVHDDGGVPDVGPGAADVGSGAADVGYAAADVGPGAADVAEEGGGVTPGRNPL